MADISALEVPSQTPQVAQPDASLRLNVPAAATGGAVAQGLEQAGVSLGRAGQYWGRIQADDVNNQFMENVNKIVYGDADNPGYLSLQGADALNQRAAYEKRINDAFTQAQNKLIDPQARLAFSDQSRRYRSIMTARMGQHADQQSQAYGIEVNRSTMKVRAADIANDPENEDTFLHATSDMVGAAVKAVQLRYGANASPEILKQAADDAKAAAVETRILAIGRTDPVRARNLVDNYRQVLGVHYARLAGQLDGPAQTRIGQQGARDLISKSGMLAAPPPVGDDVPGVVKHFEGLTLTPKVDSDGKLRIGYGSDTWTDAQGNAHPVTADTRITEEDAERDLQRRLPQFQAAARDKVGAEAWDKLSPKAKASLTSIAYNYGSLPDRLVGAVKSGDETQIAQGIRALSSDNGGINAWRRASEANNIVPGAPLSIEQEHGALLQRVLDDPYYQEHPTAQNAALSELNKYYSAQRTARTASHVAFNQRVKDTLAEGVTTGAVTTPIAEDEFVANYGPDKGHEMYVEYQGAIQFGADKKSLGSMSPQEIASLTANTPEPTPGPGYAKAEQRRQSLLRAANEVAKERREDMGKAAVNQLPAVKTAFTAMTNNSDPTTQAAVSRHFADTTLTEQERVGIPGAQRRILPTALAQSQAQRIMDADDPKGMMQQMATTWGDHWGQVFRELVTDGKLSPMMQAVAGLPDLEAKQLAQWVKGATNAKGEATTREKGRALAIQSLGAPAVGGATGIDQALLTNTDLQRLVHSWRMTGGPLAENWISGMISAVHNLAYAKAVAAGSPTGAADAAVKAFTSKYSFMPSGALVPAEHFDTVSENSTEMLNGLKVSDVRVPPIFGQPGQPKPEEYVSLLQANPQWITNPKATGLWLMDPGGKLVRRPDGSPLELAFNAPRIRPLPLPEQINRTMPAQFVPSP